MNIPSFHDGNLTGVQLAEGQVTLTLKRVDGQMYELVLSSVQALQMDDFREGNIINRLRVIQGSVPHSEILERLFPPPHPSAAENYHAAHAKSLQTKALKVEAGEAVVILIDPSYGADLVAFCDRITITALTTTTDE
ncbi:hypothetical protein [Hyphomicrobium sp. 2TAF46]|uniref:hypothetical protein n=1 Tax=Hyphomicrobium sp. 2TAF46 TaxID=3233019 RepID=UPI003F9147BC